MSPPGRAPAAAAECTIVFTDLVGYTEFTALHGDEVALDLLSTQERLVRESLPAGSRVVKDLGDGLMLAFDDACDAVRTSLALQERFEAEATASDLPLWVRIGIHSGRPVVRGSDLIGNDVNIAARIMDLAGPGEVLASEAAVHRTEGGLDCVAFEALGPVVVRGIPEPIPLYRALPED